MAKKIDDRIKQMMPGTVAFVELARKVREEKEAGKGKKVKKQDAEKQDVEKQDAEELQGGE